MSSNYKVSLDFTVGNMSALEAEIAKAINAGIQKGVSSASGSAASLGQAIGASAAAAAQKGVHAAAASPGAAAVQGGPPGGGSLSQLRAAQIRFAAAAAANARGYGGSVQTIHNLMYNRGYAADMTAVQRLNIRTMLERMRGGVGVHLLDIQTGVTQARLSGNLSAAAQLAQQASTDIRLTPLMRRRMQIQSMNLEAAAQRQTIAAQVGQQRVAIAQAVASGDYGAAAQLAQQAAANQAFPAGVRTGFEQRAASLQGRVARDSARAAQAARLRQMRSDLAQLEAAGDYVGAAYRAQQFAADPSVPETARASFSERASRAFGRVRRAEQREARQTQRSAEGAYRRMAADEAAKGNFEAAASITSAASADTTLSPEGRERMAVSTTAFKARASKAAERIVKRAETDLYRSYMNSVAESIAKGNYSEAVQTLRLGAQDPGLSSTHVKQMASRAERLKATQQRVEQAAAAKTAGEAVGVAKPYIRTMMAQKDYTAAAAVADAVLAREDLSPVQRAQMQSTRASIGQALAKRPGVFGRINTALRAANLTGLYMNLAFGGWEVSQVLGARASIGANRLAAATAHDAMMAEMQGVKSMFGGPLSGAIGAIMDLTGMPGPSHVMQRVSYEHVRAGAQRAALETMTNEAASRQILGLSGRLDSDLNRFLADKLRAEASYKNEMRSLREEQATVRGELSQRQQEELELATNVAASQTSVFGVRITNPFWRFRGPQGGVWAGIKGMGQSLYYGAMGQRDLTVAGDATAAAQARLFEVQARMRAREAERRVQLRQIREMEAPLRRAQEYRVMDDYLQLGIEQSTSPFGNQTALENSRERLAAERRARELEQQAETEADPRRKRILEQRAREQRRIADEMAAANNHVRQMTIHQLDAGRDATARIVGATLSQGSYAGQRQALAERYAQDMFEASKNLDPELRDKQMRQIHSDYEARLKEINEYERRERQAIGISQTYRGRMLRAAEERRSSGQAFSIADTTMQNALSLKHRGFVGEALTAIGYGQRELELFKRDYIESLRGQEADLRNMAIRNIDAEDINGTLLDIKSTIEDLKSFIGQIVSS